MEGPCSLLHIPLPALLSLVTALLVWLEESQARTAGLLEGCAGQAWSAGPWAAATTLLSLSGVTLPPGTSAYLRLSVFLSGWVLGQPPARSCRTRPGGLAPPTRRSSWVLAIGRQRPCVSRKCWVRELRGSVAVCLHHADAPRDSCEFHKFLLSFWSA